MPVDLEQMLAPSHSLCCAVKIDPHFSLLKFLKVVFRISLHARANQSSWISSRRYFSADFQPEVRDRFLAG
jgi:hypothetical protein